MKHQRLIYDSTIKFQNNDTNRFCESELAAANGKKIVAMLSATYDNMIKALVLAKMGIECANARMASVGKRAQGDFEKIK